MSVWEGLVGAVQPRVLVIEPDEAIASLIALALRDEGYAPTCTHDAGHALALLNNDRGYDLVLSTPLVPAGAANGYAWLEQLRAYTHAAIIICVREPGARYSDYAAHGFAAVLEEPFGLGDMLGLVATLCPATVARDENGGQNALARARGEGEQW